MCRAKIPRFYYDSAAKDCKFFFYGGCKGNQNRFTSYDKCTKQCKKQKQTTTLVSKKPEQTTTLI